jgi:hypothetical protein
VDVERQDVRRLAQGDALAEPLDLSPVASTQPLEGSMPGAFFNFLIALVGLALIVGMIFLALDRIAKDDFLKRIGKIAVGGCAVLILLIDVRGVFFGGGGAGVITPSALIEFAIGVIILIAVFYLLDMAVTMWVPQWAGVINYVLSVLMLVLLLVLAEQALFGGGLGIIPSSTFSGTRVR